MGLFDKGIFNTLGNATQGMMDMIRCDLPDYLVWQWRPMNGQNVNRAYAIRWGSSLRVRDGEAAVFVYKHDSGVVQEVIYGPYDGLVETKNFPIIANIVAYAYGGGTPFQADIYYINLAGVIQMKIGIPYTDTADPRFPDFIVPVAAGGTMTFKIADLQTFIRKHRLINFTIEQLREQVRQIVERIGKTVVGNAPYNYQVPLNQIERLIDPISEEMGRRIGPEMLDFGIEMVRWDLNRIETDKHSAGWEALMQITRGRQQAILNTQTEMEVKNLREMQAINAENMAESLRVQREELQRAQRLQTESAYISAHAINKQTEVLQTAAENLGSMTGGLGSGGDAGGIGMNPAGMMAGMYMGGAVGGQFFNMMNQMNSAMSGQYNPAMGGGTPPAMPGGQTPPPQPQPAVQVHVLINGQTAGPFDIAQLRQLVSNGTLTASTYVWMPGMPDWQTANNVPAVAALFVAGSVPPQAPTNTQTPPVATAP